MPGPMRNLFDQYKQPENQLTHALFSTLDRERRLIRPFLRWLGFTGIPPVKDLRLVEQQVPGEVVSGEDEETSGLPDACIYTDHGWSVLFECKVQAETSTNQLQRHRRTAARHGYENAPVVLITVDKPKRLPAFASTVEWCAVYEWFGKHERNSEWVREFRQYMRTFETKQVADNYDIRGTLTMFDGIRFDANNPYNYPEAKRLIRLLGDELQQRKDLHKIGIDPEGKRRSAIKGRQEQVVWDYLSLKDAAQAKSFTDHPHFTILIERDRVRSILIIPNGMKPANTLRDRLRSLPYETFHEMLCGIERRAADLIRPRPDAQIILELTQRHFINRQIAVRDGVLRVDLRTMTSQRSGPVKFQPEWARSVYDIAVNKRSGTNVQLALWTSFSYRDPDVRSKRLLDLVARSWIAMKPLLDFVRD